MRAAAAALGLALALWAAPPRAQEAQDPAPAAGSEAPPAASLPTRITEAPGTWDLSRDGTNRRCVMTLSLDSGEAGRRLHFPAGCRRALPVMAGIAGWLFTDDAVRLVDRNVRPILLFARRPDRRSYIAKAESGESYSLVPLDIAAMRPPEPEKPEPPTAEASRAEAPGIDAAPRAVPQTPPPPGPDETSPTRAAAPAADPAAPAPGLYALDRFQDRDTCRLTLGAEGGAVTIEPGCRDGGLEVFDPVRWRYARGRITLTAKRGHSIDLVPGGEGRWRRDPEVGTTFVLRRVEP